MLDNVKKLIDELPDTSFPQFFQEYVISVQDSNIDAEFAFFSSRNCLTPLNIGTVVQSEVERLVDSFGKYSRRKKSVH